MSAERAAALRALAESVEKSNAGSTALDAKIAIALGWTFRGELRLSWLRPDGRGHFQAPAYTSSVDAAKTLEREGWTGNVNRMAGSWYVHWTLGEGDDEWADGSAEGPHAEPRARVSAALRALAAEAEAAGGGM